MKIKKMKIDHKIKWKNKVRGVLLVILVLSIVYAIIKIINAPSEADQFAKVKSDYVLMLLQCLLGIFVMMIPSIIERKKSIDIPDSMEIAFFVFLFCAIFLGEVQDFYYLIPHWDVILHAFSGCMLGALGFSLVNFLNNTERLQFNLSPSFVALFAFCFALSVGTLWEVYEYLFDGLFNLNMQKFILADGTVLAGREALSDTMDDLIVDVISASIIPIAGYFLLKKDRAKEIAVAKKIEK